MRRDLSQNNCHKVTVTDTSLAPLKLLCSSVLPELPGFSTTPTWIPARLPPGEADAQRACCRSPRGILSIMIHDPHPPTLMRRMPVYRLHQLRHTRRTRSTRCCPHIRLATLRYAATSRQRLRRGGGGGSGKGKRGRGGGAFTSEKGPSEVVGPPRAVGQLYKALQDR